MLGERAQPYDLIVIGGGINGAGVARDAAMRGLSVALFEMRDLSTGATWASSGMIHGGLRYLKYDPEVTRLACLDSGYIQQIAPHLIFRIPFLMPWSASGGLTAKVVFELAEVYFDAYDRYQPLKRGLQHCRLTAEEVRAVEPGIRGEILGAITMDEWGIDAQRLTIVNALDAQAHGASLHTYHRVERLLRADDGTVRGVAVSDRLGGGTREVFARAVLNASGPWSSLTAGREGVHSVRVRPGKGVHLVVAGRVTNYAVIAEAIDGRQIFLCPQQNTTIIGTTDDDYFGDLEDIPVLEDDVEYLLQGVEQTFPTIRQYPIIQTTVGCRATLYEYGKSEDALSREHVVVDHADDGADGFYSIAGGKLASYRVMAEETTDVIARKLGNHAECQTAKVPMPGGHEHDLTPAAFTELGLPETAAQRLLYRHGDRAEQIRQLMLAEPATRAIVDPFEPVTDAELRYCIRHEHVEQLDDLKRRARLGIGADGGARSVARAAQIFCQERDLGPDAVPELVRDFLQMRWMDRRGIVGLSAKRGEAMAQHLIHQSMQLARSRPPVDLDGPAGDAVRGGR